jgi:hypothetical protein
MSGKKEWIGTVSHSFRVYMIIIKDPIVIMKCRMTSRTLFPYFNLCLSEKVDSIPCSFDIKTFSNDPKVKYHGTYNKDGFGVVIRNLSEADLNVTYRCIYGFDLSTPKYLLHGDVFTQYSFKACFDYNIVTKRISVFVFNAIFVFYMV